MDAAARPSAPSRARRCSSPAARAASVSPSRCARRATAPTSRSRRRPSSRIRSCPGRSTRPPPRSIRPAARALPSSATSATRRPCRRAVDATVAPFGGIDILVNNASAISLTGTLATPMKRFDLMFGVNVRGTFLCSQACLPHLKASAAAGRNPHILTLSPPLNIDPKWFRDHVAYTMAKYGMSMCVLGMAEEFRADGIAVNALWPRTVIATAAVAMIPGAAEQRRHDAQAGDPRRRGARDPRRATRGRRPATSSSTRTCWPRPASPTSRATRSSPARRCCPTSSSTDGPRAAWSRYRAAQRSALAARRYRLPMSSSTIAGAVARGASLPRRGLGLRTAAVADCRGRASCRGPPPARRDRCRDLDRSVRGRDPDRAVRRRRPAPWGAARRCRAGLPARRRGRSASSSRTATARARRAHRRGAACRAAGDPAGRTAGRRVRGRRPCRHRRRAADRPAPAAGRAACRAPCRRTCRPACCHASAGRGRCCRARSPRTRVARPSLRPSAASGAASGGPGCALRSARPAIALSLALRTRAFAVPLPGLPVRPATVPLALRRGTGRLHPGGDEHGADFLGRELERLPALHARRHRHRSVPRADQPAHREAERLEQPPHLAIAAFLDARRDTSGSTLRRRRPRASRPCRARPRARCRSSSACCCSGVSVPITRTAYSRSTS